MINTDNQKMSDVGRSVMMHENTEKQYSAFVINCGIMLCLFL